MPTGDKEQKCGKSLCVSQEILKGKEEQQRLYEGCSEVSVKESLHPDHCLLGQWFTTGGSWPKVASRSANTDAKCK